MLAELVRWEEWEREAQMPCASSRGDQGRPPSTHSCGFSNVFSTPRDLISAHSTAREETVSEPGPDDFLVLHTDIPPQRPSLTPFTFSAHSGATLAKTFDPHHQPRTSIAPGNFSRVMLAPLSSDGAVLLCTLPRIGSRLRNHFPT